MPPPRDSAGRYCVMKGTFWRLQLIGWGAFWLAMMGSRVGRFPFSYMIVTKGVFAALGLLYTSLLLRPIYRRLLRGEATGMMQLIAVTAVASYIVALLWTISDGILDIPVQRAFLNPKASITNEWQLIGGALYNSFTMLAWSVLYVGLKHFQALQAERERALRAEALAQSARLEALRYQLNPHFLFNALNGISALVVSGRGADAATMIARLADLLRSTLDRPDGDVVPLSVELDVVRKYLDVEQARFADRLHVDMAIDGPALKARVPALLLQPIVENAVRHAVAPREEGGRIAIAAERVGGRLRLVVEDDGPGLASTGAVEDGVGLKNTRERLAHSYGDAQALTLERGGLGGLRVKIELPYAE